MMAGIHEVLMHDHFTQSFSAILQAYSQKPLETAVNGNGAVEQKGHPAPAEEDITSGGQT